MAITGALSPGPACHALGLGLREAGHARPHLARLRLCGKACTPAGSWDAHSGEEEDRHIRAVSSVICHLLFTFSSHQPGCLEQM